MKNTLILPYLCSYPFPYNEKKMYCALKFKTNVTSQKPSSFANSHHDNSALLVWQTLSGRGYPWSLPDPCVCTASEQCTSQACKGDYEPPSCSQMKHICAVNSVFTFTCRIWGTWGVYNTWFLKWKSSSITSKIREQSQNIEFRSMGRGNLHILFHLWFVFSPCCNPWLMLIFSGCGFMFLATTSHFYISKRVPGTYILLLHRNWLFFSFLFSPSTELIPLNSMSFSV